MATTTSKNHEPPFLSAAALRSLLPWRAAIDALEAGFAPTTERSNELHPRLGFDLEQGDFLLMSASGPEGTGTKLVTVVPQNLGRGLPLVNGLYALFAPNTLALELMIDGAALTELRTASVSALAARHLARPDSSRMVVFGAGVQARAHIRAMREVLPIEAVTIVGRSSQSGRALDLCDETRAEGLEAQVGTPEAVRTADLVCTCTSSVTPIFDPSLIAPGTHISAVGSFKPTMSELDPRLFERALLVVETRDSARAEAGEIIHALASGILPDRDFAVELGELLAGHAGRRSTDEISVFKSVGLPSEDLIVARAAARRLHERLEYASVPD